MALKYPTQQELLVVLKEVRDLATSAANAAPPKPFGALAPDLDELLRKVRTGASRAVVDNELARLLLKAHELKVFELLLAQVRALLPPVADAAKGPNE